MNESTSRWTFPDRGSDSGTWMWLGIHLCSTNICDPPTTHCLPGMECYGSPRGHATGWENSLWLPRSYLNMHLFAGWWNCSSAWNKLSLRGSHSQTSQHPLVTFVGIGIFGILGVNHQLQKIYSVLKEKCQRWDNHKSKVFQELSSAPALWEDPSQVQRSDWCRLTRHFQYYAWKY